jgi:Fe-S-cluster containining protein
MISEEFHDLCLECGLCCNGVLFADVQLQPGDDAKRLELLGLSLLGRNGRAGKAGAADSRAKTGKLKFAQPCAAFGGDCRCRIYPDRPKYCREFECLLLKSVIAGETKPAAARGIVRTARRRVEKVERLLRELGDADKHLPLTARFRRVQKRLEQEIPDQQTAAVFGQLTLAVHDLTVLLSDRFYSGPEATSSR